MIFRMRHPASVLAMMLAGATLSAQALPELPAAQLQVLTAQEGARAAQAAAYLAGQVSALGLTPFDAFTLRHSLTNPQGVCVARFDQTNHGMRVPGASIVVKVAPGGALSLGASSVVTGIDLPTNQPTLTPAQALEALTAKLSPTVGYAQTPSVEPIVYPTRLMGDLVLAKDEATGLVAMDPLRGSELYYPPTPHVQGYRITAVMKAADAQADLTLTVIMDATTGAILDRGFSGPGVTNPFAYATGPRLIPGGSAFNGKAAQGQRAATAAATATPVVPGTPSVNLVPKVGFGSTEWSGTVRIPTTYDPALKGYGLLDTTRGSANNYFVQARMGYNDTYGTYHYNTTRPSGNMVATDRLNVFVPYTMDGLSGSMNPDTGATLPLVTGLPATPGVISTDDWWGNYTDYTPVLDPVAGPFTADGAFGPAGQTAAAEAMNTMTCAYEFLKYEFNRLGLDNKDSAMTAIVNDRYYPGSIYYNTIDPYLVNPDTQASLGLPDFVFVCGAAVPGTTLMSAAEPTLMGQAIGNMLWEWVLGQANVSSLMEGRLVQRGFANFMSQAILNLGSLHGLERVAVLPSWSIGRNYSDGSYATSMFMPSLDGVSSDFWYDGLSFLGNNSPQFGEGPMDRAFFFMANGGSSSATSQFYSAYLPAGSAALGMEKTAKILYKAITEELAGPDGSCLDMRNACIKAAADLYGAGGAEVVNTTNAFAAVNIGTAYGAADPVRVQFNLVNFPDNSDMGLNGLEANPRMDKYPIMPMGEPTQFRVGVTGTQDLGVVWTCNPANYSASGAFDLSTLQNGQITPDGVYTAPLRGGTLGVYSIQATSHADPKQFAQGLVTVLGMDYDGDGNNDALDFGMLGLAYGLPYSIYLQANEHLMIGFPGIGEGELQMNLAAFQTAFGN